MYSAIQRIYDENLSGSELCKAPVVGFFLIHFLIFPPGEFGDNGELGVELAGDEGVDGDPTATLKLR